MNPSYQLALATDLDGTFLEGDQAVKNIFYNELIRLREQVLLIYVTGRSVDTLEYFCKNAYLPHPHFIIADHGTHIVDGKHFEPIQCLQDPIIETWNDSNITLKKILQEEPGIVLQPIDPPYRVAYYYDPHQLQNRTLELITQAGFDVILSCDMYLDIVPRGVNKGSSLMKLINHANVNQEIVITSGDSLNDLSLFQTGLKSIAVGNAEPKLRTAINNLCNVYLSKHPGLLGVIDGLHFYNKLQLFQLHPAA
ncbi:MAG: hypothetical protein A3F12_06500 [Gammaproteobacteria bacterium RIFCSPHIGHO2_12_FULL_38_14]|nr:MAG: hypothetical protein A3F12_06500 [Gammaproteobacteria bacterium RIFCSPHIGHO2_12_FULL_38_14]